MKVANYEWNALMSMFKNSKDAKQAKALFEMWLDEKFDEVYKEGWLDACKEYDIDDDYYTDEDDGGYIAGADW